MQLLFDFFPVVAFFVAYQFTDIYTATGVLIVAVIAQTSIQWLRHRKVNKMALTSGVLVLVFGGITLAIHDKVFLQWKVTIVNWLFAAAFLASRFFGERTMVQRMMGESVTLAPGLWHKLNWAWVVYFLLLGALNLYVAYHFSEAAWVNFKMFGIIGLTFAFAFAQAFWVASKTQGETNP